MNAFLACLFPLSPLRLECYYVIAILMRTRNILSNTHLFFQSKTVGKGSQTEKEVQIFERSEYVKDLIN